LGTQIRVDYRIPNPLDTFEQFIKYQHRDLPDLDDLALWRECKQVEIALAFAASKNDSVWLIKRWAAVRREERARGEKSMLVDDDLFEGIVNDHSQDGARAAASRSRSLKDRESGTQENGLIAACDMPEPEARRYVVPGLMPDGALTILYGDGGLGKSYLALYFAMCAALGRPIAGRPVKKRTALYLDAELEQDEFLRRAYWIARGLGLERPPEGLH
jgi:AAA domain